MTVVIVGAGPCGLACAHELQRLGHEDWVVLEREAWVGGNGASFVDDAGFTWDIGCHVVFSHFGEFDRLLAEALGADFHEHDRSSFVHFDGRFVPYPFQNNLRYLAPGDVVECLLGLIEAPGGNGAVDFGSWLDATFGPGIARLFLRPYNTKIWTVPPEEMSAGWIAERVPVVDYRRALENVVLARDDVGWGPNNRFRFPTQGGTGEIYRRLASTLGDRVRLESPVARVDPARRTVELEDGERVEYETLVSTIPLDRLVAAAHGAPSEVREAAASLVHTSVAVVGVGLEAPLSDDRSWFYHPDPGVPFYRATNFAKYAPANVPGSDVGRFSSWLTETSFRPGRPPGGRHADDVRAALVTCGLVTPDARVASLHRMDIEYAYPVPTVARDAALTTIEHWLVGHSILSRGRFGTWRYEIGNMDHAVKMGVDAARLIAEGRPEELLTEPRAAA